MRDGGGEARWTRLVARARAGEREALEELLRAVRDDVFGLALKMLWHPQDAEDATQEILLRILTHLGSFRGDASFRTWAYRIAANYLLTTRKRRMERAALSFEEFGEDLISGLSDGTATGRPSAEEELLEEEVKIGCTQGMLLCLDRPHRLAYILGEVFGLESGEAAEILATTPAAYRKRLSRARQAVREFMSRSCGLVNAGAACRCGHRVERAIELGRVDPDALLFTGSAIKLRQSPSLLAGVREMEELHATAAVFRSHPERAAPDSLVGRLTDLLRSGRYSLLEGSGESEDGPDRTAGR